MERVLEDGSLEFTLCKACEACPKVVIRDGSVSISDEAGSTVKLTLEQFRMMQEIRV